MTQLPLEPSGVEGSLDHSDNDLRSRLDRSHGY